MASKIKKILVPLDGSKNSERGLDKAIYFARQFNAILIGLFIKPQPGIYAIHPLSFIGGKVTKEMKKFMESAKTKCAQNGIDFSYKMIGGEPGYDIVRFAHSKKNKIDMIVIGTRGRGSAREIFFGSTSNYVLHKAKIPVLIVR